MENPKSSGRFEVVNLSFNIGGAPSWHSGEECPAATDCGGVTEDCNGPTCGAGSCSGASSVREGFDATILVEHDQLRALRAELRELLARFTD